MRLCIIVVVYIYICIYLSTQAIEADRRKVERCFPALLNKWLQGDPQIKDLLKSLKGPVVDRPDLASQLEEKIKTGEIKWNKC